MVENTFSEWKLSCPPQESCECPGLQANYSQVPVDWHFQSTTWPDREYFMSAPAQQDPVHNMDWFKDGSVLESEVEVFTRNPTVAPYSVIKPNMSDKPPDGGWRTTSWQDFEEFTRLVCGNQGHSSHTRNSVARQFPLGGAAVAFDISKACNVICLATWLKSHMSAGFRSASSR